SANDEGQQETNPLLRQEGLPEFEKISPEFAEPALEHLLKDLEEGFAQFEKDLKNPTTSASWDVVERLEKLRAPLEYAWGVLSHLSGVKNSDPLRDAYQALQPRVVTMLQKLGQSKGLYNALKFLQVPASTR
ncbi:unnamed protein product, partial [Discosporangium mesarthrocarpum]